MAGGKLKAAVNRKRIWWRAYVELMENCQA
jgi:hypothetical protein